MITLPPGKYPKLQPCKCDPMPTLEVGRGGVDPGVGNGTSYIRWWMFCPVCQEVVQEWNTREEAGMAEMAFVGALNRRLHGIPQ